MFKYQNIFAYAIFIIFCVNEVVGNSCDTCDENACAPPQGCFVGLVKDACNCCYVCGRKEGERCDKEELNFIGFGKCGENLECRVRSDLKSDDHPEAVCFCASQNPLCGSDGVTYENVCQFTEERYRRRDGLRAVSAEPCVKSPKTVIFPQNVRNSTGTSVAMRCEASAWPVPTIEWFVLRNHTLEELPGNNTRMRVQSRSGPGIDETTGWLLIMRITKEDEGTYICKVKNDVGSESANATLFITS